jgi:hypothetical protein
MLEAIQQGFLGLVLFFSQWAVPAEGPSRLGVESVVVVSRDSLRVRCRMEFVLSKQVEELVDAGIPLRFRMTCVTDRSDTASFLRILTFDVADYTYTIADSMGSLSRISQKYPMILLAIRDFSRWEWVIPRSADMCRIEACILPSPVKQLGRSVDMSKVWGQKKASCLIDPAQQVREAATRRRGS